MANDNSDEIFLRRLMETFRLEARERLDILSNAVVSLESITGNSGNIESRQALIETIFREVHSLKGAARAVDKFEVERLCQSLEGILSSLKRKDLEFSPDLADVIFSALDLLNRLLTIEELSSLDSSRDVTAMISRLDMAMTDRPALIFPVEDNNRPPIFSPDSQLHIEEKPHIEVLPASDTVRISARKLDSLLLQVEGFLSGKLSVSQRATDAAELHAALNTLKKEQKKISTDIKALTRMNARVSSGEMAGEGFFSAKEFSALHKISDGYEKNQLLIKSIYEQAGKLLTNVENDKQTISSMVDDLLEDIKNISMVPASSAFSVFPKLVRDLARSSGKEIEFILEGGEVEIDRRILEDLRDPLMHLLRNAIDHGIEKSEQRLLVNKPARAVIKISIAQYESGKIQIEVRDDGQGIDRNKLRNAAIKLYGEKHVTEMDDAHLLDVVFESGLSTSALITDISGRGLGLAIVRDKVETMGGRVQLESHVNCGTCFVLTLPVTLSTYRGVYVFSGGRQFIFPLNYVDQVIRVRHDEIHHVHDYETITWNEQPVRLVRLSDLFTLPSMDFGFSAHNYLTTVIVAVGGKSVAFIVDAVMGELDVLVKRLGPQLLRVKNIAGATVLGNGDTALILNVVDLIKSVSGNNALPKALRDVNTESVSKKSILIAEDSITSRMLLRGIFEAAGYRVVVAVDGEDAFNKLRGGEFDLLVSDVEMPRLDGFDLTAKIRADPQLSNLPVVLVTSLASVSDRERGIDVGASAYVVKSNFEQGNLLDIVRRLL